MTSAHKESHLSVIFNILKLDGAWLIVLKAAKKPPESGQNQGKLLC
ncbi:hypothetical protein Q7O_001365 [Pectobacterium carotovorum subsp. carotovorum PCCS1]|jgi:hypothetical protein|nr:hypothetical protein [Pectobacterium carotovorum subsp. carotovorum PCCS1]